MSVYIKEPEQKAQACVIWMHGLGADSSDMAGLANQLKIQKTALRHVFIDAPTRPVTLNGGMVMPAWFDILGMELIDRIDSQGIKQSEKLIREVMNTQLGEEGFTLDKLFLAGFSQGGAMALHTALNTSGRLGGVIALSAYLPLASESTKLLDKNTPFYIASGLYDPLVLPLWTTQSKEWIVSQGYEHTAFHQYPMEHAICVEEILDISRWLENQVTGAL